MPLAQYRYVNVEEKLPEFRCLRALAFISHESWGKSPLFYVFTILQHLKQIARYSSAVMVSFLQNMKSRLGAASLFPCETANSKGADFYLVDMQTEWVCYDT